MGVFVGTNDLVAYRHPEHTCRLAKPLCLHTTHQVMSRGHSITLVVVQPSTEKAPRHNNS